jgi:3-oxoacyl-[acyl-carrier-protein] synthase II
MKLAVTGVGIVSPLGNTLEENMTNLRSMQVPLRDSQLKDDPIASHLIRAKKMFHCDYSSVDVSHIFEDRRDEKYADPICVSSMIAVEEAVNMCGMTLPKSTSVHIGSIQGGCHSEISWVSGLIKGRDKIHPKSLLNSAQEYVSNLVASYYDLHGTASVVSATCISGVQALQNAHNHLVVSDDDCAIVGATDFMTSSTTLYYFQMLGAFSETDSSRPWDKDRNGIVMGEASVYLIVEPLHKAIARGANIRWVIDGIGIASDAHHPTQPDPAGTGGKIAIEQAMRQAGTAGADYTVFNAHATGTDVGDPIEYNVLKQYFPSGKLYSNKGQVGHMMGASCLGELVFGAEAMIQNWVPGNAGLETPFTDDTHFDLTRQPVELEYNRFMKTSFGFGGRSSAVSVSKY